MAHLGNSDIRRALQGCDIQQSVGVNWQTTTEAGNHALLRRASWCSQERVTGGAADTPCGPRYHAYANNWPRSRRYATLLRSCVAVANLQTLFRRLIDVRLLLGGARAERTPDRVTLCARSGAHFASALHDQQDQHL